MRGKIAFFSIICFLLSIGVVAWNQEFPRTACQCCKNWFCMKNCVYVLSKIDLESNKRDKIEEIRIRTDKEQILIQAKMKVKYLELEEVLKKNNRFDRGKVRTILSDIKELRDKDFSENSSACLEIFEVLNPEERKAVVNMMKTPGHCSLVKPQYPRAIIPE